MGTYYIKPTGMSQKDLVNLLKDLETAFGGTNSTDSITIQTTFDAVKPEKGMSVAKSVITAGSIWESAVSVAVRSGYAIGYNNSYGNSAAKSYATSAYTAQSTASSAASAAYPSIALSYHRSGVITPAAVMDSVIAAGSNLHSAVSVAVASGHTSTFVNIISVIASRLSAHSI